MITLYTFDNEGFYIGSVELDPYDPMPIGTLDKPPNTTGSKVARWKNGAWEVLLEKPNIVQPIQIPATVSPRQIRQALSRANLRSSVESAVAAGDQDTKDWYEFATEFQRNSPIVAALGVALNVTSSQLDDLWILANSL